jgi:transposase
MTVTDVAKHVGLDWKTVKNIDKAHLETQYAQPNLNDLEILAVDEISIRKGHNYLTVVLDYRSGRIVYIGKDRKAKTLKRFFNQMTVKQRKSIKAIAMDMWDPFIKAVKKNCRRPKSSLICFTSYLRLAGSSTKYATLSTAKPPRTIRPFLKAHATCC